MERPNTCQATKQETSTVAVATECRLISVPGLGYLAEPAYGAHFWQRYLEVFEKVIVVARVFHADTAPSNYVSVECNGLEICELPHYIGPFELIQTIFSLRERISRFCENDISYVLRAPGIISGLCAVYLSRRSYPFSLEVVGVGNSARHRVSLWRLYDLVFQYYLRFACSRAIAISYVTKSTIQREFPPLRAEYVTHYSSITLKRSAFRSLNQVHISHVASKLIFVGSLEVAYKGLDVLLHALKLCNDSGCSLCLTVLGGGRRQQEFECLAHKLGLANQVSFYGSVPSGTEVVSHLDEADIFIIPSLTEGLPRALIEAMARGLPAIGSDIGGIPELLDPEDLVAPGDPNALHMKIIQFSKDAQLRKRKSERNQNTAKEYGLEILANRRAKFYGKVKALTEDHSQC